MPSLVRSVAVVAFTIASVLAQQPTYHAAVQAVGDPALTPQPGGTMLSIPGLFDDFVIAGGGQFVELPNGNARLTGRIHSETSLYSAFLLDIEFSGRLAPGNTNFPPPGSPQLLLDPTAYVPTGSIDPGTFVYYTTAAGTLRGTHAFDGARIDVQLGPLAAQTGHGANNRNGTMGVEAELSLTVVQQPAVPFGAISTAVLRCDLPTHRTDTATHPQVDPTRSSQPFGRALSLPGIGDDYMFVPAGEMTEFDDGHAEIEGVLARISQLDDAWQLSLTLTNRCDPGQPGYPPTGNPILQMLPTAYASNGGNVDPAHWRYYKLATGTLTGLGINQGGSIALLNSNTAVQFGGGANQTNMFHGCYGEFTGAVTTQPTGRTIALTGDPELFGIGARFPVLPFPTLVAPTTPYTLPTLTDQGFVLEGDNLAWVELVAIDINLAGLGNESNWYRGWIRVIDNQHIEVHPRPGLAPGIYDMRALNPAVVSNLEHLDLTEPTTPARYAQAQIGANETLHLMTHRASASPLSFSVYALSFTLAPTVFPGIVTIDIGAQGQDLGVIPGSFTNDPVTGIAQFDVGPIPAWFTGLTIHYQAVIVDLGNLTLPLPATNVWTVVF